MFAVDLDRNCLIEFRAQTVKATTEIFKKSSYISLKENMNTLGKSNGTAYQATSHRVCENGITVAYSYQSVIRN